MVLNAKAQYALVIIKEVYTGDFTTSLQCIADKHKLSIAFLEQISRKLRIKGLIRSVRGPGGGYAKPLQAPSSISLSEVLEAVDSLELKIVIDIEPTKESIIQTQVKIDEALRSIKVI